MSSLWRVPYTSTALLVLQHPWHICKEGYAHQVISLHDYFSKPARLGLAAAQCQQRAPSRPRTLLTVVRDAAARPPALGTPCSPNNTPRSSPHPALPSPHRQRVPTPLRRPYVRRLPATRTAPRRLRARHGESANPALLRPSRRLVLTRPTSPFVRVLVNMR
ncbi:hypothetical protein OH76DRAFT_1562431 [Lentinus brumalis]|uniref:Uncharacterized protein n=1 Tax=Lentinus brumalis TaxID=2498619 RepID=A0A371CGF4_9APHY|nr:hypothetical protein OH76DRAFT_1562431 [Polyporus brumalis]